MRKRITIIASIIGIVFAPAAGIASMVSAQAPEETARYFPETGHTVREPFIGFFNATDGVTRYGFPLTDDYVDKSTGLLVQYFQRARLEWHPGNPIPYKIQLGLLGDELGKRTPPIPVSQIPAATDPSCRYFPETGHNVCLKFLDYWLNTGGLDMYGYPIAEHTIENGRIVQYFQRARMEWHPEKPEGQRIQLAPLGKIYYDFAGLDTERLKAQPISANYKPVALKARGSVLLPMVAPGSTQTGFLYVSDQLGNPLEGVGVTLVVYHSSGSQSFTLPPTNQSGATAYAFPAGQARPGMIVPMEFIVTYQGLFTRTRTSYLMWFY